MKNLDRLHRSMIVPFVVMQLFIAGDYWFDFLGAPWGIHVHVLTVFAWYLLLMTQPYLIAARNIATHRTVGIFGFLIAGGVAFTAISLLPNTVGFGRLVEAEPGLILDFEPEFFYAIAVSEFILAIAFLFAVYKAIVLRKSKEDHAAWLISTAFIMLFPAVGRGVQNFSIAFHGPETDDFFARIIVVPSLVTAAIIIGLALAVATRHAMQRHPAIILAVLVNLVPVITQCFPGLIEPLSEPLKAVLSLRFRLT